MSESAARKRPGLVSAALIAATLCVTNTPAQAAPMAPQTTEPMPALVAELLAPTWSPVATPAVKTPAASRSSAPHTTALRAGAPTTAPVLQQLVDQVVADGAVGMTLRSGSPHGEVAVAAGTRRPDKPAPALPQSPFRVASNTKMMTATLAMQLVEEGTWSVDTTVDRVLPGQRGEHGAVTVRQLMQHESGIPDGVGPALIAQGAGTTIESLVQALESDYDPEQIVALALAEPWLFEPGSQAVYSNTGYILLGLMLQEQTGTPLATLMKKRIFAKAGMRESSYATEPALPGTALVDTLSSDGETYVLDRFDPDLFAAAGAVVSTTDDLTNFLQALLSGRLVKPATLAQMQQTRPVAAVVSEDQSVPTVEYGYGLIRGDDPCVPGGYLWGHDGATLGTLSTSLGSADGTRVVTAGWNDRYLNSDGSAPYDPYPPLVAALTTGCAVT